MVNENTARDEAIRLSSKHPGKPCQVYRADSGVHWLRFDPVPLCGVDGMNTVHIATYLNVEEI